MLLLALRCLLLVRWVPLLLAPLRLHPLGLRDGRRLVLWLFVRLLVTFTGALHVDHVLVTLVRWLLPLLSRLSLQLHRPLLLVPVRLPVLVVHAQDDLVAPL